MKPFNRSLRSLAHATVLVCCLGSVAAWAQNTDVTDLLKGNQPQAALKILDKRLAATPKDPQLRFLQGVAQAMDNKNDAAIATFERLTQEYPELPEPYNNLAVLYANQNQLDKSRQALERAIRTNPSYATAHENLGDIYAKLASQAYSKALQLDTQHAGSVKPKLALIHELFTSGQNTALAQAGSPAATAERPVVTAAATSAAAAAPVASVASAVTPAAPAAPAAPTTAAAPTPTAALAVVAAASPSPATTPSAAEVPAAAQPEATTASAAPTSTPAQADTSVDAHAEDAVQAAVNAWAKAWASQNMQQYLAAYSPNFQTPGKQSRRQWEQERRARIEGKRSISVDLSNLQVQLDGDQATVRFVQAYRANTFSATSRKTLVLQRSAPQQWLIVRETVGN